MCYFWQVPIILPISVLCVSIYLVIAPIINDPRIEFLYAFIFVISGLVFYVPFVVMKKSLPYTGKYNWILYNSILLSEGGVVLRYILRYSSQSYLSYQRPLKYIKKTRTFVFFRGFLNLLFSLLDTVTKFIQLVLWCAPSKYESEIIGDWGSPSKIIALSYYNVTVILCYYDTLIWTCVNVYFIP